MLLLKKKKAALIVLLKKKVRLQKKEKRRKRRSEHPSSTSHSSQRAAPLEEEALPQGRDGEKSNRFTGLLKSLIGSDTPTIMEAEHESDHKRYSEQSQSSGRRRRKKRSSATESSSHHSHRSRHRTHTSSRANNPIEDWVNNIETDQEYHSERASDTDRGQDGSDFYFTDESDVKPVEKAYTHSRTSREQSVKSRQDFDRRRDSGYASYDAGSHLSKEGTLTEKWEHAIDSASSMTPPERLVRKEFKKVAQKARQYDRGLESDQAYASDEETLRLRTKHRSHHRSRRHQARPEHRRDYYDSKTVVSNEPSSNNPFSFFGTRPKPRTHSVVHSQTSTSAHTRSSAGSSRVKTGTIVEGVVRIFDYTNGDREIRHWQRINGQWMQVDASERPAYIEKRENKNAAFLRWNGN